MTQKRQTGNHLTTTGCVVDVLLSVAIKFIYQLMQPLLLNSHFSSFSLFYLFILFIYFILFFLFIYLFFFACSYAADVMHSYAFVKILQVCCYFHRF